MPIIPRRNLKKAGMVLGAELARYLIKGLVKGLRVVFVRR